MIQRVGQNVRFAGKVRAAVEADQNVVLQHAGFLGNVVRSELPDVLHPQGHATGWHFPLRSLLHRHWLHEHRAQAHPSQLPARRPPGNVVPLAPTLRQVEVYSGRFAAPFDERLDAAAAGRNVMQHPLHVRDRQRRLPRQRLDLVTHLKPGLLGE